MQCDLLRAAGPSQPWHGHGGRSGAAEDGARQELRRDHQATEKKRLAEPGPGRRVRAAAG